MSNNVVRGLVGVWGLLSFLMGLGLWFNPTGLAEGMGLAVTGTNGIATLRADVAGYFGVVGLLTMLAALRHDHSYLKVPMLLIAAALIGRIITFVFTEASLQSIPPMIIEVLILALYIRAGRSFQF